MEEVWKNIEEEGFEFYQVSNLGRIRIVERDVPTRIINHGKEMIVNAHRKGKYIAVQYDGGRPSVRMMKSTGEKCRRSLPLLVLMHFGEPCPGDIDKYTAGFIDGDVKNTNVNNLMMYNVTNGTINFVGREDELNGCMKGANFILDNQNSIQSDGRYVTTYKNLKIMENDVCVDYDGIYQGKVLVSKDVWRIMKKKMPCFRMVKQHMKRQK